MGYFPRKSDSCDGKVFKIMCAYLHEIGVFFLFTFCANKQRRIDRIMNKKNNFLQLHFCLMALAGCTQKTELPENPKDQEEYRDHQGNSWIYNAMLMRLGINAVYGQRTFYHTLLLS